MSQNLVNSVLVFNEYGQEVDNLLAKQMIKAYQDEHASEKDKTLAVWFSQKQIVKVLEMIGNRSTDGVRIYFAKYAAGLSIPNLPNVSYIGKDTLVFVMTDGRVNRIDINDFSPTPTTVSSYNHGELCPTSCPDGSVIRTSVGTSAAVSPA